MIFVESPPPLGTSRQINEDDLLNYTTTISWRNKQSKMQTYLCQTLVANNAYLNFDLRWIFSDDKGIQSHNAFRFSQIKLCFQATGIR